MRTSRPTEKKDLKFLNKINVEIINLRRKESHPFSFFMDSGDRDNAIGFTKMDNFTSYMKPVVEGIRYDRICVPDLLCLRHKLIIEYNELPVGSKNANKRKKGHTDESIKDMGKIDTYLTAGFSVLIIYDFEMKDGTWEDKLYEWITSLAMGEERGSLTQ